jgi:teichuronic acid biosynthesis glycosyltransferase TuaH
MSTAPVNAPVTGVVPRDVVLSLCFITWEDAHLRGMHFPPDRLIQALIDAPEVGRLLVVDPFRDRLRVMAKRALGRTVAPALEHPGTHHLQPLRIGRSEDPIEPADLERRYGAYDRQVQRAADAAGLEDPVVLTTNPFVAGFSPLEWASSVTYYVWDDWAAHPRYRPWWPALREGYDRVRASERRVCAVSQTILDRARPAGPALLVPNGVTADEWRTLAPAPEWFRALPGPKLMYAGTLDGRIDRDLVLATARAFPEGSVVLVGLIADPDHLEPLRALPNVHIRPPVERDEITAMIHAADVCLVPHARDDLTAAMSPLKLYEYLAAGRPVAATDLPPMRDLDDRVVLAGPEDDYVAAVRRALALGPASEERRLAFVEQNAWTRRHADIIGLALA